MSWDSQRNHVLEKWKSYWYRIHPHDVAEYTWEYLFTGGKELRARLFCDLWMYLSPDTKPDAELAFAIECIHVSSLVLDDTPWMDNATTRRGRTTLHIVYSDKKAILVAYDVLRMVEQIWRTSRPSTHTEQEWLTYLYEKMERLIVGQWYDMMYQTIRTDDCTLYELASFKTGVLFELVTETVAHCVQLHPGFWASWGNRLGVLFQWADDWHDREEDHLSRNRNAFNEAYVLTYQQYGDLFQQLCREIGPSWFLRPLGKEMHAYFTSRVDRTDLVHLPIGIIPLGMIETVPFPPPCIRNHPAASAYSTKSNEPYLNHTGCIQHIFTLLKEITYQSHTFPMITVNLWEIPEDEWTTEPEILEWLERIQQAPSYQKYGHLGRSSVTSAPF